GVKADTSLPAGTSFVARSCLGDSPAQHGHGSGRQRVHSILSADNGGSRCWSIRVRIAIPPRWMPLVLILSKSDHRHRPGKATLLFSCGSLEHDSHGMIVVVVLIDQQKGP